jgi:uncharacterized membrane protein
MKSKQYKFYKLLIVIMLAVIVGGFVTNGNFIIPLIVLLVAVILMFFLKRNVNEIMNDERIEQITGKASRLTFTIATFLMAISGLILIALRDKYPETYIIGNMFAYLTCGLLFLYAIIFKYYSRKI